MNVNGFDLMARVEAGDPEIIKKIDRVAWFARTRRYAELVGYRTESARDKMTIEALNTYLLARILENVS